MTNKAFDLMSIIHFLVFIIFGLIFKNEYNTALLIGVLWEIIEYYILFIIKYNKFNEEYTKKLLKKYWPISSYYWNEKNISNKIFDIVFNMSGYYIGNNL